MNKLFQVLDDEWRDVLGVSIAVDRDDFFELGGDSFLALSFADRVQTLVGIKFPIEVLFIEGTLGSVKSAYQGVIQGSSSDLPS